MRDATSAVVMLEEASLSYILTSTHVVPSGSGLNLPASAVLLAHPASLGVQTGCGRVYWTHSNAHEVGGGVRHATSSRKHGGRADSSHLEREPSTAQGQSGARFAYPRRCADRSRPRIHAQPSGGGRGNSWRLDSKVRGQSRRMQRRNR